jgi:hypothetical protein
MGRLLPSLGAFALLLAPTVAFADGTADARALYDQGAAALDAGDYARAASLLGDADALSPNPMVLGLAIRASQRASDAVLAEDLALRADARGSRGDLAILASQTHDRFRSQVGRVRIVCESATSCVARIGSTRWVGGELHAVAPGIVDVVFDGSAFHVRIEVGAGSVADLVQPHPPAIATPPDAAAPKPVLLTIPEDRSAKAESRGLPSWVFWTGLAVTAGLGAGTGASGLNTHSLHESFVASPSIASQQSGESAELRTNVLLGSTVAVALVTGAIGIFYTRWRTVPAGPLVSGRVSW